jgi:hypothetical protein|tara:strand:+ start:2570 stop:2878 length:309 start_codon:yes stop_codon:yes gene_type:complete
MLVVGYSVDDESNEINVIEVSSLSLAETLAHDNLITASRPQPPIHASCDKYIGLLVPILKLNRDSFEVLYGGAVFKDSYPLISDSRLGDDDYKGRWMLYEYS